MDKLTFVGVALSIVLAGCGGGGGDGGGAPPPAVIPEGLWLGSTNTNRTITGLVLDTGTYYFLYSAAGNSSAIAGFVQGTTAGGGTTFTSADTRDFNLEGLGVLTATIQGSFVLRQSLNGTVNYGTLGTTSFTTGFSSDYDTTPSLSTLAGTYTGQSAVSGIPPVVEVTSLTITIGGSFTGSGIGGCTFSGTATPRTRGNAYNVTINFGGSPCINAGQTFSGIGYYDAAAKRLYAAAPNSARTLAVIFVGTKP